MIIIESLDDISALRESYDIECKLANGQDSNGKLPKDFWKSYSAFANTDGGIVYLGLKENDDSTFEISGLKNPQKILDDLWNNLNNKEKINSNILSNQSARIISIENQNIIEIQIPKAQRTQRPVFLNNNPHNSFERCQTGDQKMSSEKVHRMLAEQIEDSRDGDILQFYTLEDLSLETITQYRQLFSSLKPDHPWSKLDTYSFLKMVGAVRRDRQDGIEGVTKAGLLMFGTHVSIQEIFPHYFLDYQERPEAKTENRWVDRVTLDGTWSGNIFDFYQKVIRKLTAELKIPFKLEGDKRKEDTPIHEALREALINTLAHADYTERCSILVVKRPDMFGFRNPGMMRIPIESALSGGLSDCRNKLVHQMFRYVNLGEQAGSGIPKILVGWEEQHWRRPSLKEKREPSEQTLLELHTLSLIPEEILSELTDLYGAKFTTLTKDEQIIILTAYIEGSVNHARMMEIMNIYPHDLTNIFSKLASLKMLHTIGSGRGTSYAFPNALLNDLELLIANKAKSHLTEHVHTDSEQEQLNSEHLSKNSEHLESEQAATYNDELQHNINRISSSKLIPKEVLKEIIIEICTVRPHTLYELSQLLNRAKDSLRNHYLKGMIQEGDIQYLYPTLKNHPDQAYTTNQNE